MKPDSYERLHQQEQAVAFAFTAVPGGKSKQEAQQQKQHEGGENDSRVVTRVDFHIFGVFIPFPCSNILLCESGHS